jgi:hypothetical protein
MRAMLRRECQREASGARRRPKGVGFKGGSSESVSRNTVQKLILLATTNLGPAACVKLTHAMLHNIGAIPELILCKI